MTRPCIAAGAIATFVGKKTFESNEFDTSSLLIQNVEALAEKNEYVDNMVSVRRARAGICWKNETNYSKCTVDSHDKNCKIYTITWSKDHDLYYCMNIPVDRYINGPSSWTLCQTQDNQCTESCHRCNTKPDDETNHTTY